MTRAHLNRRDLLAAAGAAASAGLAPTTSKAASRGVAGGEITDMTMNSPSYATPIGYGVAEHPHHQDEPLLRAFES